MRLIFIVLLSSILLVGCQFGGFGPVKPWPTGKPAEPELVKKTSVPKKKYTRGNKSPYEVFGKSYEVMSSNIGYREVGTASWYGKKFHGRLTSNGEVYDMYQISAAHKALPLPSIVRVTNLENDLSVVVRVNDRGPFHGDRLIDLSYETARILGFANQGTARVMIEALDEKNHPELKKVPADQISYYLQVGAFANPLGAESLLASIKQLLVEQDISNIEAHILQSEFETGLLHKVWLGPIENSLKRESIATLVVDAKLGTPINVEVK